MAKTMPEPEYSRLHLWRYANIEISKELSSDNEDFFIDHQLRVGVCGDWLMGGRVESAYLSGLALAKELKQWL
jgi:predicted NAD/FAD-dependent oxidoreductase